MEGPSSVDDAIDLHDRAVALQERTQLAEAEDCCRRSLLLFEQIDGSEHPDVANVLNTLASICAQCGRHAEAEGHALRAERIMEKLGARVEGIEAASNL
jgi:hypothetical protein